MKATAVSLILAAAPALIAPAHAAATPAAESVSTMVALDAPTSTPAEIAGPDRPLPPGGSAHPDTVHTVIPGVGIVPPPVVSRSVPIHRARPVDQLSNFMDAFSDAGNFIGVGNIVGTLGGSLIGAAVGCAVGATVGAALMPLIFPATGAVGCLVGTIYGISFGSIGGGLLGTVPGALGGAAVGYQDWVNKQHGG
jgi:hypothetical protein